MKKKSRLSSVDKTTIVAGAALSACAAVLLLPRVRKGIVAFARTYYEGFTKSDDSVGITDTGTFHEGNGVGEVEGRQGRWQPSV